MHNTIKKECIECSRPVNTTLTKGEKKRINSKTINCTIILPVNFLINANTINPAREENRMFNNIGILSLTPKIKYKPDNKTVQSGEEEQEVNSYLVIPQTPCKEKFFAIAI
jgi:hypothetical protein